MRPTGGEADTQRRLCWSCLKRVWENGQLDDLEKTLMDSNSLYYGDNLDILRRYVRDDSADLIYLDPPFNSNQTYNVLFQEPLETAREPGPVALGFSRNQSASQIKAFGIPGIGMKQRRVRMKRRSRQAARWPRRCKPSGSCWGRTTCWPGADRDLVAIRRGAANRLGLALQLCALRYLGFVPRNLSAAPRSAACFVADQLEVSPDEIQSYARREQTRFTALHRGSGTPRLLDAPVTGLGRT